MIICKASKRDKTANARFRKSETRHLEAHAVYKIGILHSNGVVAEAAGRLTLAKDKIYLNGARRYPPYDYVEPDLGDSRPARLVSIEKI